MNVASASPETRWQGAWLDALAFAGGLAVAWWQRWETADLVWSLWLSSLVVGYALIVWSIFAPAPPDPAATAGSDAAAARRVGRAVGAVFLLPFFTLHFGGFHFVHSVFLQSFFPVPGTVGMKSAGWTLYGTVVAHYGWFLPAAFLAERAAFRRPARAGAFSGGQLLAPYVNVVRLHLLIFFFAFAHFARLDGFAVYATVYAVYFFPWRRLRRPRPAEAQPT